MSVKVIRKISGNDLRDIVWEGRFQKKLGREIPEIGHDTWRKVIQTGLIRSLDGRSELKVIAAVETDNFGWIFVKGWPFVFRS